MAEMKYHVVWTDEAIETKNNIYQYLQDNWSKKEIESFFTRLDGQLALLSIFPKMGKPSDKKPGYRETVLSPHQTIYYKLENNRILIASIFDNRQDPNSLNL